MEINNTALSDTQNTKINVSRTRRIESFVWGGIVAAVFVAIAIYGAITKHEITGVIGCLVMAYAGFAFTSCLILKNNIIRGLVAEIFSWGFVTFPGLITTFDLDGLIWLILVKLLFGILGLLIALIAGVFAVILGIILSVFVYPFALVKSFKKPEETEI